MKRLILTILVLAAIGANAAPQFLRKGLDLTGQNTVTGAQLNQMIDNAVPTNWVGFVIRTNGRPQTSSFGTYSNFLWLDIATTPATLKSYVCCGDADTNWVNASTAPATIGSAELESPAVNVGQIYANAVVTSNLTDSAVTSDKLSAGAVTSNKVAGSSISSFHIFDRTITGDDIATLTITDTNIAAGTITGGKLAANTIPLSKLGQGSAGQFLAVPAAGGDLTYFNFFKMYSTNSVPMPSTNAVDKWTTNYHNLGAVPNLAQISLLCTNAELGYAAGDEVTVESAMNGGNDRPFFSFMMDSGFWYFTQAGMPASCQIRTRTNPFAYFNMNHTNWNIKATFYRFTAP